MVEEFKIAWRDQHPATARFWYALEKSLHRAMRTGERVVGQKAPLACEFAGGDLYLILPSGRRIVFPEARFAPGRFGRPQITFKNKDKNDDGSGGEGAWGDKAGWYGLFTARAVSGIARDLLAAAMQRIEAAGYAVVLTVHDEVICEVPAGFGSIEEFRALMTEPPAWAAAMGIPIVAEVWRGQRYGNQPPTAPKASGRAEDGADLGDDSARGMSIPGDMSIPGFLQRAQLPPQPIYAAEPGADGKEQFVIPGAERVASPKSPPPESRHMKAEGKRSVTSHNLDVALQCADAGLHVFAAAPNKKPQPGLKWRDLSTRDPATIEGWFARWPDALPGVDLAKSGHLVIDGDRHGGPDGVTFAEELFAEHGVDAAAVPTVLTPGNGKHFWFANCAPPLGNSDKPVRDKGINVRGAGGYVIAPGTRLPDGRLYDGDGVLDAVRNGALPRLSPAIEALLRPKEEPKANGGAAPAGRREESYAQASLNGLAEQLGTMSPNTGRNIELNNAAMRMGHMVGADWCARAAVEERLFEAAVANGLVAEDGAPAVRATIKSGLDAGEKAPQEPLPAKKETLERARASTFEMEALDWFWTNRFALGKIGLIVGLPDEGKGQLLCYMVAQATQAGAWPCGEGHAPQGNVVFFTAEDDISDTVAPRLAAAGADRDRVEIVKMVRGVKDRMFNLATDLDLLRKKILEVGDVRLVLIDPITAYLGVGKVDSFRTTDVRAVLGPLVELAAELRVAIVAVMHFNKKIDITNALLRISDSLAFAAVARHVYGVIDDAAGARQEQRCDQEQKSDAGVSLRGARGGHRQANRQAHLGAVHRLRGRLRRRQRHGGDAGGERKQIARRPR
jgi:hypothetical protein